MQNLDLELNFKIMNISHINSLGTDKKKSVKYQFGSRLNGKSFAELIQLKQNINKGLKCAVATSNPEKLKQDFEYMTGAKLKLELFEKGKDVYKASLIK